MPTIAEIFSGMSKAYVKGSMEEDCSFYFSLDDDKFTVLFEDGKITVEEGKTVDEADCVLKTSADMFRKIWEGYKPGMMDFMSGKIKTNNPTLLQNFDKCFKK
jgi:putative sterol carrier protein